MVRTCALVLALLLAGCAMAPEPKLAVCDGQHRRPANPYGSVLLPAVPGPGAGKPAAPTPATPGPQASVDPQSFAPCGARA